MTEQIQSQTQTFTATIQMLARAQTELAAWQGPFLRAAFFLSQDETDQTQITLPISCSALSQGLRGLSILDSAQIDALDIAHKTLDDNARTLIDRVFKNAARPTAEDLSMFMSAFQNVQVCLQTLERALHFALAERDPLTGFKTPRAVISDLMKEQDRRERKGLPFCIVLVRVDHVQYLEGPLHADLKRTLTLAAANLIRKSLRSFDDTYRLEEDMYLITLKQADVQDATRFSERLRDIMMNSGIHFDLNGERHKPSLSFCIAEPLLGENLQEYINQMRTDMELGKTQVSRIVQFREISAIERYVREHGGIQ